MSRADRFREIASELADLYEKKGGGLAEEWAEADFDRMCKNAMAKKEMVNHPQHYNQGGIECIDVMLQNYGKEATMNFCKLNAFKYIYRLGYKDEEAQEIGKIKWYLDKYLELKNN